MSVSVVSFVFANPLLLGAALWLGLLLVMELGAWFGARALATTPGAAKTGPIEAAIFGLLGLLLAFTFSGAANRFDVRRSLIVQETNAINTAWLRLDLLPLEIRPAMQALFRDYVDSRIAVYANVEDDAVLAAAVAQSGELRQQVWTEAVTAVRHPDAPPQATMLLLPALNSMIDISTTRYAAARTHPPGVIFLMLLTLEAVGAFLAGHALAGSQSRSWSHRIGFATILALSTYLIFDIEFPRLGLVQVTEFDAYLLELRATME